MWQLLIVIFAIILLLIQLQMIPNLTYENFMPMIYDLPEVRRNMSYDLRGDPYIPYVPVSPWNNPSVRPIRNRQMLLQSE